MLRSAKNYAALSRCSGHRGDSASSRVAFDEFLHPRCPVDVQRPTDFSGWICAPNGAIPEVTRERWCSFDGLSFHWFPKERLEDEENRALLREFENDGP
ncbi:hypothetical protein ColKHC_04011 [Colletotrichum higginsianum]|uniref:Uncharacterized protein n=1 Tax=Colletotrichum higginsianum TaxID=80884 RepID=A0A4T0W7N1_9PEZI|nr:hypothetical protein CH35J_004301 [Colletotrichum higginsianum]GJC95185.1 hypothetical protein ColKHC_04011 [Colletotrichum higginsianum]